MLSLAAIVTASAAEARDIYVAANGSPKNDGTASQPLNLATALSSSSPARPGDTIWLRGGTYKGTFISYLTGTEAAPIIVRQYPGERAVIDMAPSSGDALLVFGAHTWYWGFEIISSDLNRVSAQTGSWPNDIKRGYGVNARGRNLKFINIIAHDLANGFGIWAEGVDNEVYGSLVYYNGWQAPDRAHGHGIYTQNKTGRHVLSDNITFDQFSHGIHAYGSDKAFLDNITLDGNISFGNGSLGKEGITRELLLGGGDVAANPIVTNNSTYGAQVNFGYSAGCTNASITGNYFVGTGVLLINCQGVFQGNTIHTTYNHGTLPALHPNNTYLPATPTIPAVVRVRPNRYEAGRAHIAVYNWPGASQVSANLATSGLAVGQAFEIRDAQNYFGAPVYVGVYDGAPVSLTMGGTIGLPIGNVAIMPKHTGPRFGAFVVVPMVSGGVALPAVPTASLIATPSTITAGGTATLTWTTSNAVTVTLAGGPVDLSGSMTVQPSSTTTYTVTAVAASGLVASSSVTITVTAVTAPPVNVPPAVTLTSPAASSTQSAPANVALTATATDSGGVSSVSFYQNGVFIGKDTTSPYSFAWNAVQAGVYALTATATDGPGLTATSAVGYLTVTAAPAPGTFAFVSPVDKSVVRFPADVVIETAGAPSGTTRVDFFKGSSFIGRATVAPYKVTYRFDPGQHTITARAYNAQGALLATAPPVTVTLNRAPIVYLVSPGNGATYKASTLLRMEAIGTDVDGQLTGVQFLVNGAGISTDTVAPYQATWTPGTPGTYDITAEVTDNHGAKTTSSVVRIKVN